MIASRRLRVGDTWGCGRIGQTPRMQYTASAFAEPLRRVFAEIYRPTSDITIEAHPESRYFVREKEYRAEIYPWFERRLYGPLLALLDRAAARTRRVQHGLVHVYLLYMAVALIALLVLSRWL
jgi:hydrogenase-4 component B